MNQKRVLVAGASGQLGRALSAVLPEAHFVTQDQFDISKDDQYSKINWTEFDIIINAAAYTAVEQAETDQGRIDAWQANAAAVGKLAGTANRHHLLLVHISSDYVFDGTVKEHLETEPLSPLGIYGQSKAAGDIAAGLANKHYIVRTSWVIGDGKNFVRAMRELSNKGVSPKVVSDQIGRPTFTKDLAEAIVFLIKNRAPFGIYNFSNGGKPVSWADLAKAVYRLCGRSETDIIPVTSAEYFQDKPKSAPRPRYSTLSLAKFEELGFKPRPWQNALEEYLEKDK